jgi:hypothetical protein
LAVNSIPSACITAIVIFSVGLPVERTVGMLAGQPHPIASSGRGGSPPLRRISRSNAVKSARARRSAKNSAVPIAASFSATAVATN